MAGKSPVVASLFRTKHGPRMPVSPGRLIGPTYATAGADREGQRRPTGV